MERKRKRALSSQHNNRALVFLFCFFHAFLSLLCKEEKQGKQETHGLFLFIKRKEQEINRTTHPTASPGFVLFFSLFFAYFHASLLFHYKISNEKEQKERNKTGNRGWVVVVLKVELCPNGEGLDRWCAVVLF